LKGKLYLVVNWAGEVDNDVILLNSSFITVLVLRPLE
jgi:hypothetical protein